MAFPVFPFLDNLLLMCMDFDFIFLMSCSFGIDNVTTYFVNICVLIENEFEVVKVYTYSILIHFSCCHRNAKLSLFTKTEPLRNSQFEIRRKVEQLKSSNTVNCITLINL